MGREGVGADGCGCGEDVRAAVADKLGVGDRARVTLGAGAVGVCGSDFEPVVGAVAQPGHRAGQRTARPCAGRATGPCADRVTRDRRAVVGRGSPGDHGRAVCPDRAHGAGFVGHRGGCGRTRRRRRRARPDHVGRRHRECVGRAVVEPGHGAEQVVLALARGAAGRCGHGGAVWLHAPVVDRLIPVDGHRLVPHIGRHPGRSVGDLEQRQRDRVEDLAGRRRGHDGSVAVVVDIPGAVVVAVAVDPIVVVDADTVGTGSNADHVAAVGTQRPGVVRAVDDRIDFDAVQGMHVSVCQSSGDRSDGRKRDIHTREVDRRDSNRAHRSRVGREA